MTPVHFFMSYPWFVFICILLVFVLTGSLLDDSIRCWYAVSETRHCFMCLLRARCFMSPSHWVICLFMFSAWTLMWLAGWDDSERLLSRASRYFYAFYSDSNDDDHYNHLMCLMIYIYMYIYALCQDCNLVTISKFAWPLTIGRRSDLLTFICTYHMHLFGPSWRVL